ncbi:MAG: cytochrome c biogenesis protein CcsA, partial [Weeksellaceae bacterium]
VMRIREGQSSNVLISDTNYLTVKIGSGEDMKVIQEAMNFSNIQDNDFNLNTEYQGKEVEISFNEFVADAVAVVEDNVENGKPLLELVITIGEGRNTIYLTNGEVQQITPDFTIGLNASEEGIINIIEKNGEFYINSPVPLSYFKMASQEAGSIEPSAEIPITLRTLYRSSDVSFVPLAYYKKGDFKIESGSEKPRDNDETKDDALIVNVKSGDVEQKVNILYRQGFIPIPNEVTVNDIPVELSYGSQAIELPFSIYLDDFQLERYPGSSSPSAYASEVKVIDGDKEMPYRIYMNHVLDYKGYRFFQASYDTDELGTVLSVNHDAVGTWITYIGYFLMSVGMIFTFFGRASRFNIVNRKLKHLKKNAAVMLLLMLGVFMGNAQENAQDSMRIVPDELIQSQLIAPEHAEQFGRLLVQDLDGRIKPVNTLASEFVRKISRKSSFKYPTADGVVEMNVDQVFLAMHMAPNLWQRIPLIKVDFDKIGDALKDVKPGKNGLVAFTDLLDEKGVYLLTDKVEEANIKKPAERNEQDKEIIKVDERFNVLYNLLIGNYLKIFPRMNDHSNTWYSFTHDFGNFTQENADFAKSIVPSYFNDVVKGDYQAAQEKLDYIKTYQEVLGEEIIPSPERIEAELWYNKLNINFWLFQVLFTLGFIMLILAVVKMFSHSKWVDIIWNILIILTLVTFLVFAGNIALRWYVAQHAPWSNGYEMLVFVAWVLLLSGLLTFRKSDFSLPLATLFSGALMFVSYLDWLNPEITNLMPVLKSYWLKIHVATIVSSYAPLALSAVLGMMALMLYIFKTKKNKRIIDIKIRELSYINEMSMTIGLFTLSIGTFLGGVWANESWGRYWAWDPKETWALISIIVYEFVLHLRFIPKLNNNYVLNTASMFAFWSIIMTSFGVNYYLSGLHSYAAGDPMPIPVFVYYLAAFMVVIAIIAYLRFKQFKQQKIRA